MTRIPCVRRRVEAVANKTGRNDFNLNLYMLLHAQSA